MSDGVTVSTIKPSNPVPDGARIVTGSTGKVAINLTQGCSVTLEPNQSVVVSAGKTCAVLQTEVVTLGADVQLAAATTSGGSPFNLGSMLKGINGAWLGIGAAATLGARKTLSTASSETPQGQGGGAPVTEFPLSSL
ncbi:MAG TPA: hypothetical protein VLI46_12705 [Ramlibacter sp.]|nr:hypothetical protein [Ramlibacter sp.]